MIISPASREHGHVAHYQYLPYVARRVKQRKAVKSQPSRLPFEAVSDEERRVIIHHSLAGRAVINFFKFIQRPGCGQGVVVEQSVDAQQTYACVCADELLDAVVEESAIAVTVKDSRAQRQLIEDRS